MYDIIIVNTCGGVAVYRYIGTDEEKNVIFYNGHQRPIYNVCADLSIILLYYIITILIIIIIIVLLLFIRGRTSPSL